MLLGNAAVALPTFQPANASEVRQVLRNGDSLLAGEPGWRLEHWFQQAACAHPALRELETVMMLAQAAGTGDGLSLRLVQLPYSDGSRWLGLPLTSTQREAMQQGSLSLVLHLVNAFDPTGPVAGIVLDDWQEPIPDSEVTTGIVYHFDEPNAEPPNALLLVVPPIRAAGAGWDLDHVFGAVNQTFDLAKERTVDLDAIRDLGRLIPVNYLQAQTAQV